MGVFATRSPFRPNPLGLSSVRIKEVEWDTPVGPVIHVCGGDLMDGTPIYDIKPYIAYSDCHMGARSGFVDTNPIRRLRVVIPDDIARRFDGRERETLIKILELDPRPHYQNDAQKVYGMPFKDYDIHFTVSTDGVLTVTDLG